MPESQFLTPLLFWTAVSFGILLILLKKFAFPTIFKLLEEREQKIRGNIDESIRVKQEAQELLAQYEAKLKGTLLEVHDMLEEARTQARKIIEDGRKKTETEVHRMMEDARTGIARERQEAMSEIQRAAVDLTLLATEKILERKLTESDHQRFIQEVVQEISQSRK